MAEEAVSVTDVPGAAGELSWQESLALAQEMSAVALARGWPGVLPAFRLTRLGVVEVSNAAQTTEDAGAAISTLAGFLEQLLPPPGTRVEPRVPAGLRYALVRARGGITAPPFESLREFSLSLARFEQGDRAALLAGLGERLAPAREAAPTPGEAATPRVSSAASAVHQASAPPPPSPWDEVPLATPVHAAGPALLHDAARRRAGPVLTAAVVLSILVAVVVLAAAILLTVDSSHAPWRDGVTSTSMGAGAGEAPRAAQSGPPVDRQGQSGAVGTSAAAAGTGAARTDAPTQDAPRDETDAAAPEAARPGEMVEALDVGNQPVFSPSFAADGSAIFFDENDAGGGSTLKEARTGSGGRVVQVLSVVADGARNYHPRLSPDGSQVAFDSDRDGVRGVYVSDRAGQNIRRVSGAGYAAVPTWSPDGSRLAFVKAEPDKPRVWNIWLLTMATGEATRVTSYRVGQPWGASWLPDGRRICYSHEDRLVNLNLDTGESRTYTSSRKGALLRTPAVSPDGTRVIFQLHGDGAWMLDLRDGKMRKVLDDPTAEEFAWSPDGKRIAFHSRRDRQWAIWFLGPI